VQVFDEQVVDRITGIPSHSNMITVQNKNNLGDLKVKNEIGLGRGLFGKIMELLADAAQFIEERFILKGSGEGLINGRNFAGKYLELVDKLLSHPRYVLILIMATFVVVL
jgi:hypothetical protein